MPVISQAFLLIIYTTGCVEKKCAAGHIFWHPQGEVNFLKTQTENCLGFDTERVNTIFPQGDVDNFCKATPVAYNHLFRRLNKLKTPYIVYKLSK